MINLSNLSYSVLYYLNYFSLSYDKITLINNIDKSFIRLNIVLVIFYNFLMFISRINVIKNYLNNYFKNYLLVYRFNNKYHLSNNFIIKKNIDCVENVRCCNIKNIYFEFNDNNKINMLNKIKEYDSDFSIINFLKLNEIKQNNISKIIIQYIPIFKLNDKELFFEDIKSKNINYLLKN